MRGDRLGREAILARLVAPHTCCCASSHQLEMPLLNGRVVEQGELCESTYLFHRIHVRVDRRRARVAVTHQLLDESQVAGQTLQMRPVGVTPLVEGLFDPDVVEVPVRQLADPDPRMMTWFPVEAGEQPTTPR